VILKRATVRLPPGPRSAIPPVLHYLFSPYTVFPACARRYGDPFHLPIPGTPGTVVTGDPEGIKAVMSADPDTYESFITEATSRILGKHSLFFQSGAPHRAARKLLSPPFHSARMGEYGRLMERIALSRSAEWLPGRPIQFHRATQWISLEVVVRAVFGITDEERVRLFHRTIVDGLESVGPAILFFKWLRHEFGGLGPWARAQRMVARMFRLIEEEIASRRASGARGGDVLSLLLDARYDDGGAMGDDEIRDKLYDVLIAGYETTAVALAWAGYEICCSEAVRARLLDELAAAPAGDLEALLHLPWLDAICSETLRLHPNFVLLTRKLRRPFRLKGWELPPGMAVSASIGLAHFNESVFPEPRAFRPERFLDRSYSPFEYLPFGGGAQRCIGSAFALYQMKVVLATLFRRHSLRLHKQRSIGHAPRSVTVGPRRSIELMIER
jgi:cytochrome P450